MHTNQCLTDSLLNLTLNLFQDQLTKMQRSMKDSLVSKEEMEKGQERHKSFV